MGFVKNTIGAITGSAGAEAAGKAADSQVQAQREAMKEQQQGFSEVAPGLAQFLMPQQRQAFGFDSTPFNQRQIDPATGNPVGFDPNAPEGAMMPTQGAMPGGMPAGGFGGGGYGQDPLSQIRAASGVMGNEAQQAFYDNFQEDPGTQWLRDQGTRDVNRQMAGGVGLGGGSRLKAITEFSQNLANQQMGNRLNQLGGLAETDIGLASNLANLRTGLGSANAQSLSNIGQAQGQGAIGAAGARQQAMGGLMNLGGMLGGAAIMSDVRLKTNLKKIGRFMGFDRYSWDWLDNEVSAENYPTSGLLAQDVEKTRPDAIITRPDGFLMIDYGVLCNG